MPVIRLQGAIGSGSRGLSDQNLAAMIERAFAKGKPTAIAIAINSPGGSAVQSSLIAGRIRRLADEKKIPVHAFVEDVAASGGYWLACAADDIWVDPSSIVGSIGVIFASFGFHDLLQRQGVERRVHTAGTSKSFADPFRPERPEDVARIHAMLGPLHQNFIAHVKSRRGTRLDQEADLFNADIWVGQSAVDLLRFCLGLHQVGPADRPSGAGHVLDDHAGAQGFLQTRFLILGGDVGLSAGIEWNDVGDRLGRKALAFALTGRPREARRQNEHGGGKGHTADPVFSSVHRLSPQSLF